MTITTNRARTVVASRWALDSEPGTVVVTLMDGVTEATFTDLDEAERALVESVEYGTYDSEIIFTEDGLTAQVTAPEHDPYTASGLAGRVDTLTLVPVPVPVLTAAPLEWAANHDTQKITLSLPVEFNGESLTTLDVWHLASMVELTAPTNGTAGTAWAKFLFDVATSVVEYRFSDGTQRPHAEWDEDAVNSIIDPTKAVWDLNAQCVRVSYDFAQHIEDVDGMSSAVLMTIGQELAERVSELLEDAIEWAAQNLGDDFAETFGQFVEDGMERGEAYAAASAFMDDISGLA